MPVKKNLLRERFGRWTVIAAAPSVNRKTRWVCRCECGTERIVVSWLLTNGNSSSCGCYQRERNGQTVRTHGMSKSSEYSIWGLIKGRCSNPNLESYKNYGGRGVRMCHRWLSSFDNFYSDIGPRPSKQHTVERIDNNKGYGPDNCRWATRKEQAQNRRVNIYVTHEGERVTLTEAARRSGINWGTLRKRWIKGKDLFAPVRKW